MVFVQSFVNVWPEVSLTEYIVFFPDSQVPFKMVIMVFFQDFHPKKLNHRYI